MADPSYHLARFLTFLAIGNLAEAASEMADPPADLASYLRQHAPRLNAVDDVAWTTEGFYPPRSGDGRIYLHWPRSDGPWFWFSFAANGRIQAVGEQAEQPRSKARGTDGPLGEAVALSERKTPAASDDADWRIHTLVSW